MNKEYTYNIDKYTIGVDENGKDEIGLTIAIIKNGEINFLGNYYGKNARCIDLLIKENQKLKKQLEDLQETIILLKASKPMLEYKKALEENQQKEFIKYLEDEKDRLIKGTSHYYIDSFDRQHAVNETVYDEVDIILQKYKQIIGVSDENN